MMCSLPRSLASSLASSVARSLPRSLPPSLARSHSLSLACSLPPSLARSVGQKLFAADVTQMFEQENLDILDLCKTRFSSESCTFSYSCT